MWEELVIVGVAIGPIITAIVALLAYIVRAIWGERGKAAFLRYARLVALGLAMLFWGLGAWAVDNPQSVSLLTTLLDITVRFANLLIPLLPPIAAMLGATGCYHIFKKPKNGLGK